MLGAIETPEARARIGSYKPGWTPREAIKNGLMVLVNGQGLLTKGTRSTTYSLRLIH